MRRLRGWFVLGLAGLLGAAAPGSAAPPAVPDPTAALAASLRGLLIESLPTPLYEDTSHWGQQRLVAGRTRWRGKGANVHPEVEQVLKNDGRWWKVRVTASRPASTLALDVRDASTGAAAHPLVVDEAAPNQARTSIHAVNVTARRRPATGPCDLFD